MSELTPEEAVRRVKCALAEMGYGDAVVVKDHAGVAGEIGVSTTVPEAIAFTALHLVGVMNVCWSCWWAVSRDIPRSVASMAGNCTTPESERIPPRDLLRSAS